MHCICIHSLCIFEHDHTCTRIACTVWGYFEYFWLQNPSKSIWKKEDYPHRSLFDTEVFHLPQHRVIYCENTSNTQWKIIFRWVVCKIQCIENHGRAPHFRHFLFSFSKMFKDHSFSHDRKLVAVSLICIKLKHISI